MTSLHLSSSCALLVIDVQERLLGAMQESAAAHMVKCTETLVELAASVGAQIHYTEQYPKGLGPTVESLKQRLEAHGASRVEKTHFDVCAAPEFQENLQELRRRVIVCGMETHICVQASVSSLLNYGKDVLLPFDAVLSRDEAYKTNGIEVMRSTGAVITNTESIVFGMLGYSQHPDFKKFSRMIQ